MVTNINDDLVSGVVDNAQMVMVMTIIPGQPAAADGQANHNPSDMNRMEPCCDGARMAEIGNDIGGDKNEATGLYYSKPFQSNVNHLLDGVHS